MKAYAIVIRDNEISQEGFRRLKESSVKVGNKFDIEEFEAVTPDRVKSLLLQYGIRWNYPWEGTVIDFASGLKKTAYQTKNPNARIACALSHYSLWKKCVELDEPILILEHDAYFIKRYDADPLYMQPNILGINNPLGCTRRAQQYYDAIVNINTFSTPVPWIDEKNVPQGLAGNSAYIIKPAGASHMIQLVKEYGLWPNDAIMCRQLVPNLSVTTEFYTRCQNLKSTTTL